MTRVIADDTSRQIGRNIRALRGLRGLSRSSFLDQLEEVGIHLSRTALTEIELGHRGVQVAELMGFVHILDVEVPTLLSEGTVGDVHARRNGSF